MWELFTMVRSGAQLECLIKKLPHTTITCKTIFAGNVTTLIGNPLVLIAAGQSFK
ncbi:hypothetical protein HanIR_Chr07g0338911 [Helianthus annuus]|nr:hypothetical protein HanIR_Chr07g0338911 [Helianthus annuus]